MNRAKILFPQKRQILHVRRHSDRSPVLFPHGMALNRLWPLAIGRCAAVRSFHDIGPSEANTASTGETLARILIAADRAAVAEDSLEDLGFV